ncbi:oligosaccharide flippase family protein [Flexibacterium corallicola]|uniref:oligosaccharide flippase family protein n=1 Tax=Flexibacterium corallicola TaxID=3037259 RepID=UPI00286F1285|nr:oligosaccharide flippase family protein [Pseudovibrio sp. M1P-2-3]
MKKSGPLSSLARDTILLVGATIYLRALSALTTILLTRFLSESAYGSFAYGQSLALIFMFGASIGLPTYIIKHIGDAPEQRGELFHRSLLLILVIAVIQSLVLGLLFFLNVLPAGQFFIMGPVAITGSFMACNLVLQSFFRTQNYVGRQTILLVMQGTAVLLVVPACAYFFHAAQAVAAAWVGVFTLMFILYMFAARPILAIPLASNPVIDLKTLFRRTLPYGGIDWTIASFPLIVSTCLLFWAGLPTVGIFSASYTVYSAVSILALVLDQIFINELAKAPAARKLQVEKTYLKVAFVLGLSVALVLFTSSGFLSMLFFRDFHEHLQLSIQVLSIAVLFRFLSLAASSHDRMHAGSSLILKTYIGGFFAILVLAPFAVQWGILGGVYTLVLIEFLLTLSFLRKRFTTLLPTLKKARVISDQVKP